jgi:hypothetical protein
MGGEPPVLNIDEPGAAVARLTNIGADEANWSPDGASVDWSVGPSFFTLPLADINAKVAETRTAQMHSAQMAQSSAGKASDQPNSSAWARGFHPKESRIDIELPRY